MAEKTAAEIAREYFEYRRNNPRKSYDELTPLQKRMQSGGPGIAAVKPRRKHTKI